MFKTIKKNLKNNMFKTIFWILYSAKLTEHDLRVQKQINEETKKKIENMIKNLKLLLKKKI